MTSKPSEKEIVKVLAFLAALYPKYELTKATIQAYVQILADIPAETLQAAAKQLGSTSTFFPAAAELRQAAFDLMEQAQGIPTAYDAWEQVLSQFRGGRQEMHPLAQEAIDQLGGLRAFGGSQRDQEASWRARFVSAYEALVDRERVQTRMLPDVAETVERLGDGRVQGHIGDVAGRLRSGGENGGS